MTQTTKDPEIEYLKKELEETKQYTLNLNRELGNVRDNLLTAPKDYEPILPKKNEPCNIIRDFCHQLQTIREIQSNSFDIINDLKQIIGEKDYSTIRNTVKK